MSDSNREPWIAPKTIGQVRAELRRIHANNWHLTSHYEYARGYANGLHRAVSEIDNMLIRARASHNPGCASFDFDPEKQLGPDKPCDCDVAEEPAPAGNDAWRRVACELIDAIATPRGRDFQHAWEEACLFFGRFGSEPTLLREENEACAGIADREASIRRMRAQSFADDSDRADGEAQADDIEREEAIADALEYVAARMRQRTAKAKGGGA